MQLFRLPSAFVKSGTYNASVDGLRFFAFFLVLLHHAPRPPWDWLTDIKQYGWVGVDLFFVISSYLLFSNLLREQDKTGTVDRKRYFIRRFLRIYPLLAAYVLAMLWIYGARSPDWPLRLAGLLLFFDNINSWFLGPNNPIPNVNHLWSLSFEFQVYLALPLILAAFLCVKRSTFTAALIVLSVAAAAVRLAFHYAGVEHPTVYSTPFFRPEVIFIGLWLAYEQPKWDWRLSAIGMTVAGALILNIPRPWADPFAAVVQYPLIAIFAGCLLDMALRSPVVRTITSWPAIVFLGTISYGLYVFHYFTLFLARRWWAEWGLPVSGDAFHYLLFSGSFFAMALVLAYVSYRFYEKPFLSLKSWNRRRPEEPSPAPAAR